MGNGLVGRQAHERSTFRFASPLSQIPFAYGVRGQLNKLLLAVACAFPAAQTCVLHQQKTSRPFHVPQLSLRIVHGVYNALATGAISMVPTILQSTAVDLWR